MNAQRWTVLYGAVALVHLGFFAVDAEPCWQISKALLLPVLIGWAVLDRAPRIVWIALFFNWLGDIFLLDERFFTAGMAAFAAAHVSFVVYYFARNAWAALKNIWWVPVLLALLAGPVIAWAWGGVDDAVQQFAMPVYAALLIAMASLAIAFGRLTGLGATMFVVSDSLIVLIASDRISGRPVEVVAMTLYIGATYFITKGILERESMRPTDPWPTEKSPLLD